MKLIIRLLLVKIQNTQPKKYGILDLDSLIILTLLAVIASAHTPSAVAQTAVFEAINNYPSVAELADKSPGKTRNNYPLVTQLLQKQNIAKPKSQPNFIVQPHLVDKNKINPFTTYLILNGIPINHLTQWQTIFGSEFGSKRSDNLIFNGIVKLNSTLEESLTSNNIFTVEQTGQYLQLQTIRKSRKITVESKQPQTMTGMGIQMSLIASCLFPGSNSENQCTYTPGLETDRNSINPDFLVPTRINQTSKVGDVVTPESLAAIKQPGFQMGADGQKVGLDLYFPNVGVVSGNSRTNKTTVTRSETINYTPTATFSRIKQIVRANDKKAVIGLTIRGWTGIVDDKNTALNSAIQLGTQLLPNVIPHIEGSTNPVNSNVNKNLFLSARNTRIPANSFTAYQAGIGSADSPKASTDLKHSPSGKFNSVWIGLSPVIERRTSSRVHYETTGAERALVDAGAEGGVDQNVSLVSASNEQIFSTAQLEDFYTQIYLQYFNRDVNYVSSSSLTEKTSYYPHISFSGNITGSQDVFRYYGGVIFSEDVKPYIGLDYTKNTLNNWFITAGAIAYLNPDPEYYSQVLSNISKKIPLSKNANLVLSTGFNYIVNQEDSFKRSVINAPESSVTLGAKANFGAVSLGLVNFFGGILPDSIDNSLLANLEIKFSSNFLISAYFTPINDNSSRSRYGANAQLRLGRKKTSPILTFSWANSEYDFGRDSLKQDLISKDNVFSILLKVGY